MSKEATPAQLNLFYKEGKRDPNLKPETAHVLEAVININVSNDNDVHVNDDKASSYPQH